MHILTQNIAIREEQSWTDHLANAISDPKILLETLNLPTENVEQDLEARRLFPLRVPLPFVEKMQKATHKIRFLQVMSFRDEFYRLKASVKIHWKSKMLSCQACYINTIIVYYSWSKVVAR